MARAIFVKSARKANPDADIKVGDSYYWWKFKWGGKHFSKSPPKRWQLTQSDFYSTLWQIEDRAGGVKADSIEDLESECESIREELEALRDECQEKLDNMPEGLQKGSTGELLQSRIDELDSLISEIEGMDFSEPEDDDEDHAARISELIEELQGFSWGIG